MAENRVEITITADGKDAEQTVMRLRTQLVDLGDNTQQAGTKMRDLSGRTKEASSTMDAFGNGMRDAAQRTLGLGQGVGAIASKLPMMQLGLAAVGVVAVSTAISLGRFANENERVGLSLEAIGRNAGYTSSQLEHYEAQLRQANVGLAEGREALKQMALAQMDLAEADKLAAIAQNAAIAGNVSREKALKDLIRGIESGQEATLKAMGIDVNFTRAQRELAEQLGKTSDALTDQEKLQARMNEALAQGQGMAADYGGELRNVDDAMHEARASMEEAKTALGLLFTPAMNAAAELYYQTVAKVGSALKETADFMRWMFGDRDRAAVLTGQLQDSIEREKSLRAGGNISSLSALRGVSDEMRARLIKAERDTLIAAEVAAQKQLQAELETIRLAGYEKQKKEQEDALALRLAKEKEAAEEETALANETLAKLTQTRLDALNKQYQALSGKVSDQAALDRWYNDEVAKLNAQSTKKFEAEQKKQQAAHQKARKSMAKNEQQTLAAMDKYMADYEARQIKAIADSAAETRKLREKAIQEEQALREKAHKEQEEAAQRTMDRIQDATADVFYTMFKNAGDGWKNLWASMKDWALRTIAELAAKAATMHIVVPILTSMTGAGTANAAVTALSGGGASGLNLSSLSSLVQPGSLLSKIPGMSAVSSILGTTLPGTATALTGAFSGAGANTALYATGLGFSPNAVAQGALQGMTLGGQPIVAAPVLSSGLSIGSALGMGGLGGLGYTLLGGALGLPQNSWSGLTASLGGTLGAWGGSALAPAAGAALGATAGSVVPIIGTAVGALAGGLLSSVFGKKEHSPSIIFQAQEQAWGDLSNLKWHSKSGADKSTGVEISQVLGQAITPIFDEVEALVGNFGQQYVDELKEQSVYFGRGWGSWSTWDFGSDHDFEELLEKAVADVRGQIVKAAAPTISKAGQEYLASDAVQDLLGLFESPDKLLGQFSMLDGGGIPGIEEARRKFLETGKDVGFDVGQIEQYVQELQALQTVLAQVSLVWESISQASAEMVTPLSAYEQAQRSINAQFDAWVAQLESVGVSLENIMEIESRRVAVLDAAAAQHARAIQYSQAEVAGTVDQFRINEIAQRYGWDERYIKDGQMNRANVQRDAIDWYTSTSVQNIEDVATRKGLSTDQIGTDIKYLNDYFKAQDAAAQAQVAPSYSAPKVERMNTAVDRTAEEFARLTKALIEYRQHLLATEAGGGTVAQRYLYAQSEFERIADLAASGDLDALQRLQDVSDNYLDVARTYNATASGYQADVNAVLAALDLGATAGAQKSGQDLDALRAEVQGLREEARAGNYQLTKIMTRVAAIWQRWDVEGAPEVRQ